MFWWNLELFCRPSLAYFDCFSIRWPRSCLGGYLNRSCISKGASYAYFNSSRALSARRLAAKNFCLLCLMALSMTRYNKFGCSYNYNYVSHYLGELCYSFCIWMGIMGMVHRTILARYYFCLFSQIEGTVVLRHSFVF